MLLLHGALLHHKMLLWYNCSNFLQDQQLVSELLDFMRFYNFLIIFRLNFLPHHAIVNSLVEDLFTKVTNQE